MLVIQSILICIAFLDAFLYSCKNMQNNNTLEIYLNLIFVITNIYFYICFAYNYPKIFVSLFIFKSEIIKKLFIILQQIYKFLFYN
jgi:hypothetical protein